MLKNGIKSANTEVRNELKNRVLCTSSHGNFQQKFRIFPLVLQNLTAGNLLKIH